MLCFNFAQSWFVWRSPSDCFQHVCSHLCELENIIKISNSRHVLCDFLNWTRMKYQQIKDILSHNKHNQIYFLDVFPIHMLPDKIIHCPSCFLCNVDSSGQSKPLTGIEEFNVSYGITPDIFQGPISDFTSQCP